MEEISSGGSLNLTAAEEKTKNVLTHDQIVLLDKAVVANKDKLHGSNRTQDDAVAFLHEVLGFEPTPGAMMMAFERNGIVLRAAPPGLPFESEAMSQCIAKVEFLEAVVKELNVALEQHIVLLATCVATLFSKCGMVSPPGLAGLCVPLPKKG